MKKLTASLTLIAMAGLLASCDQQSPVETAALDVAPPASEAPALEKRITKDLLDKIDVLNMFEITVYNLTPSGSQPLSPPVFATHGNKFHMFQVGHKASNELEQIAEDAVSGPMLSLLASSHRVGASVQEGGPIPPGASAKYVIMGTRKYSRISMASMLVNTNDAFTGIDARQLPVDEATWYLRAYDAGTEKNTELKSHIPGPCCGSPGQGEPEYGKISHHAGIQGTGELEAGVYGWDDPVVKVHIRRMRPRYEVKFENMTPAGSQPMSPPVLATHAPNFRMFAVGKKASNELEQIAEDAVNGPMLDLLDGSDKVMDFTSGSAPIGPGGSAKFYIDGIPRVLHLSLVSMLVNTNDAFTGANSVRLPYHGSKTWYLRSYDAGTERNTELAAHIPGPCCGSPGQGISERNKVRHHAGIQGHGDLSPDVYGWDEPVAKLTITRVK